MSIKRVLRYILFATLFAVPFVPLIVSGSMFFPFITGKNFMFRILVEVAIAAWGILSLYDASYRPKRSAVLWSFLTFIVLIGISDIAGENLFKSFWSNFERMEGLLGLLHLFGFFLVAGTVLDTEKLWKRFFHVSVGVASFICMYGLFQLGGALEIHQGGVRLDATFGNATYLAVYMLFHIFLVAWLAYKNSNSHPLRWVYGALGVLFTTILYFTATRGAILGLIGGALLVALIGLLHRQFPRGARRLSAVMMLGTVVLVGSFMFLRNTEFVRTSPVLSRFSELSLQERTTTSRFLIWNMAWQGVKERPILGWGQENFIYVFGKYYDSRMYNQEPWFDRAHNIIFDWAIAGGLLGLLSYLGIFGAGLFVLWRGENFSPPEKALLTGLFVAYLFHNLFVFDNITSYVLFVSLLGMLHSRYANNLLSAGEASEPHLNQPGTWAHIGVVAIVIVLGFSLYFFNARPIFANHALLQSLAPQQEGLEKNLALYEKTIEYNSIGRQEAREQLSQAAVTVLRLNTTSEIKSMFAKAAQRELLAEIETDPENPRYPIFLGALLNRLGAYDDALMVLNGALEKSPRRQLLLFEIGNSYLQKQDYNNALATYRKAFELDTHFTEARRFYIAAAIYAGDLVLVQDLSDGVPDLVLAREPLILQAYADTNQPLMLVRLWSARVEELPDDPQTNLSLAAAYLQAGDAESAIATVQKVIKLDPEFEAQGQQIIQQIRDGTIQF